MRALVSAVLLFGLSLGTRAVAQTDEQRAAARSLATEGASAFQAFRLLLLPMAVPILAVVFVLAFIAAVIEYPIASVLLQSGLAVAMLMTHSFELLIRNIGAMLTLMSALTVCSVLRLRPGPVILGCAGVYVIASGWMLYFAIADSPITLAGAAATMGLAAVGYLGTSRLASRGAALEE